jgi:hypothetical protein
MSDFNYEVNTSGTILEEVSAMATRLSQLEEKVRLAEEAFKLAKKEYETYSMVTLPNVFQTNGLSSMVLENGKKIVLTDKFSCQPQKSDEARKVVRDFLKAHSGDALIKENAIVSADDIEKLKSAGIQFSVTSDVNTNSLKSFLKEILGYKENCIATVEEKDLPKQLGFWKWAEVEVK